MYHAYKSSIEACMACAAACSHCASSCLQEPDVDAMTVCIRLNMECAAICKAAAELMAYESQHANAISQLCADICQACAEECSKHQHEHCQQCATACRNCAEECLSMTAA